jgi:hypothetical protein
MWRYEQASGKLFNYADEVVGVGYSGFGNGKNNPAAESTSDVGPIPCGLYTIEPPHDSQTHGPFVLALTPDATNEMFGRSAFLMHGDNVHKPGTASLGCVIMPRAIREEVWKSDDHTLEVVSGLTDSN